MSGFFFSLVDCEDDESWIASHVSCRGLRVVNTLQLDTLVELNYYSTALVFRIDRQVLSL